MPKIEFYPPGSSVLLGDIPCSIITVSISGHTFAIEYEIAWTLEGDRKTAWIKEFEISPNGVDKIEAGFKSV